MHVEKRHHAFCTCQIYKLLGPTPLQNEIAFHIDSPGFRSYTRLEAWRDGLKPLCLVGNIPDTPFALNSKAWQP